MIQLIGSAPRVSNFASYSGVFTVIVRCGAALTFGVGTGTAEATGAAACCVAVGLAVCEPGAPAFGFAGGGTGGKRKLHKNSITEESINASRSRFCCIS